MTVHQSLQNRLKILLEILLVGAVGALIVRASDLPRFRSYLGLMTPGGVAGIICFQAALLALAAARWAILLREAGIYRGFRRAFLARIAGFALMYVTPAITFAGIPARARAYKDSAMKDERLYATIGVDYVLEIVGKVPAIAVGLYCLLLVLHPGLLSAALGGFALLAILGVEAAVAAKILAKDPAALGTSPAPPRFLARIAPRLSRRITSSLHSFRTDVAGIMRGRKALLSALLVSVFVSLLEVGQALFLLGFLGRESLPFAFVIFASVIVHGIIGVLPGNIGGMEGTHIAAFALLGLGSADAVFYTILLRVGHMTLVFAGVLALFAQRVARSRHASFWRGPAPYGRP